MIKFVARVVFEFSQTVWQQNLCKVRKDLNMKENSRFQITGSRLLPADTSFVGMTSSRHPERSEGSV
jgi:hypothetical protein